MQGLANLELIKSFFSKIKDEVKWDNSIGHYNIDRYLENVVAELLNEIYGYKLININKEKANYPGIDLRDKINRVAVQVTAENTSAKINDTIDIFVNSKENMKKDYDRLIVFLIKENKIKYNSTKIKTQGIKFDINKDIIDFKMLYEELEDYTNDKLSKVLNILEKEFQNKISIDLDKVKKRECVNNCEFYIPRTFIKAEEYGKVGERNGMSIEEILKKYNNVILLSEAGNGKTEEVKHLVNRINKKEKYMFPFYDRLNKYIDEDIEELIPKEYKGIEYEKIIFILDGLDEINENNRQIFIKKLERFCENNKDVKVIVTCRTNFYKIHNKDFDGMISNFNEYVFCDISKDDINLILNYRNIDLNDFWKEIIEKRLGKMIYNPFYLEKIIKLYLKDGKLPNRENIMDTVIIESFKLDENKYKNSLDVGQEKREIYNLLSIIAITLEMLGRNYLSEEEYFSLLEIKENRIKIEYSSIWKKDTMDNWGFIHNNFGEYLASTILEKCPIEDIKQIICYEGTNRIRETWVNTLSYLVNREKNKKIVDWILEVMPEFIAYIEDGVITEDRKSQVFRRVFNEYKNKKKWMPYILYERRKLINTEENFEMILNEIKRNEHYTITGNSLYILKNLENLYGKEEKVKELMKDVCTNENYTHYNKKHALDVLANLKLGDSNDLQEIIKYNKKDSSELRRGYFHYCNQLDIVTENIDMFLRYYEIEQEGIVAKWRDDNEIEEEPYSYEEHLEFEVAFSKINTKEAINKIIDFLKSKKVKERRFEKNIISNFIKSIRHVYINNNEYINIILDLYLICEENYENEAMRLIIKELNNENLKLEFFKKYIIKPQKMFVRAYEIIMDDECMEVLYKMYLKNECNNEIVLSVLRFCDRNTRFYIRLKELYEQRTGDIIKAIKVIDYDAIINKSTQKFFDAIFDKNEFVKFLRSFFEKIGKESICNDDIDEFRHEWLYTDEDYRYLGHFLRYNLEEKEKINKDMCEKWDWDYFICVQCYEILSRKNNITVNEKQKNKIYEICLKYLEKVNFRKAIKYKKDNSWTINVFCVYIAFFRDRFDFEFPKNILLDMLEYEYPIDNMYKGIQYIEQKVNKMDVKNRIIENLNNENIRHEVFENHINYCIRNKIYDCIESVGHYILNKNLSDSERINAYEYLVKTIGIEKFIERYFYNLNEEFQRLLLDRIIKADAHIIEDWMVKKLKYSRKIEKKMAYAKYLIYIQNEYGIKYYYEWCKKENRVYLDRTSYKNINEALGNVNRIELIEYLVKFLELALFTPKFKDRSFVGIYSNIRSAILNIGTSNTENFLTVEGYLKKMINIYSEKENIGVVNYLIDDIELQYCEKRVQYKNILEVRRKVKSIYNTYIVTDKWI